MKECELCNDSDHCMRILLAGVSLKNVLHEALNPILRRDPPVENRFPSQGL